MEQGILWEHPNRETEIGKPNKGDPIESDERGLQRGGQNQGTGAPK